MADTEEPAPDDTTPPRRVPPRKPGGDKEKALTLEVARLFGMTPRLLVEPPSPPEPRPEPDEDD